MRRLKHTKEVNAMPGTQNKFLQFLLLIFLIGAYAVANNAYAIDAPHAPSRDVKSVGCSNCHFTRGANSWMSTPAGFEVTPMDNMCFQCHNPSSGLGVTKLTTVRSHSTYASGSEYGTWQIECRDCHNPHYQAQAAEYPNEGWLLTGTVSAGSTTLTLVSGVTLSASAYEGMILVPDTGAPNDHYRIKSNTASLITVLRPYDGGMAVAPVAGATFGIKLGKMVKTTIKSKTVKFLDEKGDNSFARASVANGTFGICQACHTKTSSYKNDGTLANAAKHNSHSDQGPGGLCVKCHKHSRGFTHSCDECHGNPPIKFAAAGADGDPEGLLSPATGVTGTGAHNTHVNGFLMTCATCHTSSNPANNAIQMGFAINSVNFPGWASPEIATGAFDGLALNSPYSWAAGNAGTQVTTNSTGNITCSTVYCHGSTLTGGTKTSPSWVGSGEAACGSCHGASASNPPTSGSHEKHAGSSGQSIACASCHGSTAGDIDHVNGNVEWNMTALGAIATYQSLSIGSTGAAAPSAVYGTCTNACHSLVSPAWGTSGGGGGCSMCHAALPTSGAHAAHVRTAAAEYGSASVSSSLTAYDFGCGNCHPTDVNDHRKTNKATVILVGTGPLKSRNAQGAAYDPVAKTCSGVYCHSNGAIKGADTSNLAYKTTPSWNGQLSAVNKCGQCHDNPPQYEGQSHFVANSYMGTTGGHMVGIHFDNIFSGTKGLLSAGSTSDSGHGNAGSSTTMTCNLCHHGEVGETSATIDTYSLFNVGGSHMRCANCHTSSTPTKLQNGEITDKSKHVNGVKDVVLQNNYIVKSKAQLREGSVLTVWQRSGTYKTAGSYDYSTMLSSDMVRSPDGTATCTTACHNKNTVTWGQTNVTCVLCHSL